MMNNAMLSAAQSVIATTATAWGLSGRKWWPALFLVTLLAACSASLPPIDQAALPATPTAYKEGDGRWTVAPPAEAQARGEWWKSFGDPLLDDLVARANAANASIQVATARLKQARAFVRAAEAQRLPEIDASASADRGRRRAELEHALAVLVGEPASNFTLAAGAWDTALPIIPAGVPSTVLTRRPDVSSAENSLLAAQTRVGVAKAAWFPTIALTANAGYASSDLHDLFQWSSRAWGLGLIGSLPVFDGGRRKAGIENASGEFDAAVARYREQVLVAFKDVEDQLSALRLLPEQSQAQDRAVSSAARSTALSEIRYRNGYVSQLELLDAQRSELRNRREALQVRSAQYQSTVALVRALGGTWN